ncbi:MAG: SDR family oxidoreductase [Alphaproteobacteria bacterium]|nr:SDR family oxidoreductase [Alphaproteobacteria bacterium]
MIRFDHRVAVVTGAAGGLGRSYALAFARRGARVVVNDLGGDIHGSGSGSAAADAVVREIVREGGIAVANYESVEQGDRIIEAALDEFGRVDILVNNAGILRDASFKNLTEDDWESVYRVHLFGAFKVTKAAWAPMQVRGFGRIVNTASAAGIYGNFGQANYAAAKLGLVGFTKTLAIEGASKNILVNAIAPIAASRLLETVATPELISAAKPEYVTPLVLRLCADHSLETGSLFELAGGWMAKLRWERSRGVSFGIETPLTPEAVDAAWPEIVSFNRAEHPESVADAAAPMFANLGLPIGGSA